VWNPGSGADGPERTLKRRKASRQRPNSQAAARTAR